jgi:hypothetical protein
MPKDQQQRLVEGHHQFLTYGSNNSKQQYGSIYKHYSTICQETSDGVKAKR